MNYDQTKSMQNLYTQVIDGCLNKDRAQIKRTLNLLIRSTKISGGIPVEIAELCRISLKQISGNRISEVSRTFKRLNKEWTAAIEKMNRRKALRPLKDVEAEQISDKEIDLRTADPDTAMLLSTMRGSKTGYIDTLPNGETIWHIKMMKKTLRSVKEMTGTPKYLDYIQKRFSQQLSLDFN